MAGSQGWRVGLSMWLSFTSKAVGMAQLQGQLVPCLPAGPCYLAWG